MDQNLRFCEYKISPEISSLFTRCVTVSSLVFLEPQEFFLCQPLYPHLTHNIFPFLPPAPHHPRIAPINPVYPHPPKYCRICTYSPRLAPTAALQQTARLPPKNYCRICTYFPQLTSTPRAVKINYCRICTYPSSLT